MLEERKNLPAWKSQKNIIETLKEHQVVVISGMTGYYYCEKINIYYYYYYCEIKTLLLPFGTEADPLVVPH